MSAKPYDIAIIGGGIVGLASAMALVQQSPGIRLVVLEAEDRLAQHQTGHNSGVIHSGLYYKPGSLKARNCVEGRDQMYRFCAEHGIAHERCGKIVVATTESQIAALEDLERRGKENGLQGIQKLGPEQLREHEPRVRGVAGLLVPDTGIVDFLQVAGKFADAIRQGGGELLTGARVRACRTMRGVIVLETEAGETQCKHLINCGGLQCDRVARLCGVEPNLIVVPFRGEYYELTDDKADWVKNLIYPTPDPRFPFLGVHFTRRIGGGVEAGPNAVLAFKREGYRKTDISVRDVASFATYGGFWRMASRYWRTALGEFHRSYSKRAFVAALRGLIPELEMDDVRPAGSGVRAQALEPDGTLVDDFRILEDERMIHVLNAPSPAATASISIGRTIAKLAARRFDLPRKSGT